MTRGDLITTQEKAEAIPRKMVKLANEGKSVTLEEDWGGNTATVCVGGAHTHVGIPDGEWELLIENLYNSLHDGTGLSWV